MRRFKRSVKFNILFIEEYNWEANYSEGLEEDWTRMKRSEDWGGEKGHKLGRLLA